DTDPLKVGTVKDGGAIDFKDRGEIPQVRKDDLLAEKTPSREGTPGSDVYGLPIPAPAPREVKIKPGKGTRLSEDGTLLYANIDGRPEFTAEGRVSVFPELRITGDVDLKTGHVIFDGDIIVSGTVQNGFRVKGGSLSANEILRAEIEMDGDVVAFGGIIGATIRTAANVRARYIHDGDIEAMGDVVVEKEIIDSRIETSGECITKRGHIFSSQVFAKKGIQAIQIGSPTSKACTLVVGVDMRVKREIEGIKEGIAGKQKEKEVLEKGRDDLDRREKDLQAKIGEKAQIQDRSMVKQRELSTKLDALKEAGQADQAAQVEAVIQEMEEAFRKQEEALEALFEEQDGITEELSGLNKQVEEREAEIEQLNNRIVELTEWSRAEKGNPVVQVQGEIMAYTVLKGLHASLTLPENHSGVTVKEGKVFGPDKSVDWKFRITRAS
ncbi:MAG: DUF342 domain-containing protein, partial [Deltaproteobacteria bacterium]|nr:DUF342 domain-containing protein [Deltaproteobacteria bacterium]